MRFGSMKTIKIKFTNTDLYRHESDFMFRDIRQRLGEHYILTECDEPDFLFCTNLDINNYRDINCVKVVVSGDPYVPDFNEADYVISNVKLSFGERHLYYPYFFMNAISKIADTDMEKAVPRNTITRFCNFIYNSSSRQGNGKSDRIAFCKELMNYKSVDCPGAALHNYEEPLLNDRYASDWEECKIRVQSRYKFTIAFENSLMDGYITEKIVDPLIVGSLPIYYGSDEVLTFINPDCFISANEYMTSEDGMRRLAEKVKEIDGNPDLYQSYFSQPFYDREAIAGKEKELDDFLIHIIEDGTIQDKDPYNFSVRKIAYSLNFREYSKLRLNHCLNHMPLIKNAWKKFKTSYFSKKDAQ